MLFGRNRGKDDRKQNTLAPLGRENRGIVVFFQVEWLGQLVYETCYDTAECTE
jgi:hypothetical protein